MIAVVSEGRSSLIRSGGCVSDKSYSDGGGRKAAINDDVLAGDE
jgi:hypothetical protein